MIDLGFKVAVIEQTEDRRETDERIKINMANKNPVKTENLVKRQICGIFTKGITPAIPDNEDYDAKWILAIFVEPLKVPEG